VIREKGLEGMVEEVIADPYADDPLLLEANPIAQVPALVTDDGLTLTDSPLICGWLDAYSGRPRLVPEGDAYWRVRRRETLADGVLELAVKIVLERRRPEAERSPSWIERWGRGLERALGILERGSLEADPLDLGLIAVGVVGPYLDFRHPDLEWRGAHPKLAAFSDALARRPSFQATEPA
jgi:glutathione S-transferase